MDRLESRQVGDPRGSAPFSRSRSLGSFPPLGLMPFLRGVVVGWSARDIPQGGENGVASLIETRLVAVFLSTTWLPQQSQPCSVRSNDDSVIIPILQPVSLKGVGCEAVCGMIRSTTLNTEYGELSDNNGKLRPVGLIKLTFSLGPAPARPCGDHPLSSQSPPLRSFC